jgi:hypothetical protein
VSGSKFEWATSSGAPSTKSKGFNHELADYTAGVALTTYPRPTLFTHVHDMFRPSACRFPPQFAFEQWNRVNSWNTTEKCTYLIELDVSKPLVVSILQRSEELRLYTLTSVPARIYLLVRLKPARIRLNSGPIRAV